MYNKNAMIFIKFSDLQVFSTLFPYQLTRKICVSSMRFPIPEVEIVGKLNDISMNTV